MKFRGTFKSFKTAVSNKAIASIISSKSLSIIATPFNKTSSIMVCFDTKKTRFSAYPINSLLSISESVIVLLSNTKAYVSALLFEAAITLLSLKDRFSSVSIPVTFNAVFA